MYYQVKVVISPSVYILSAVMLLLLPPQFLISAFAAAAVHECCHLAALCYFRIPVHRIDIIATGAKITAAPASAWQEFFCTLAGPFGSFLCVFLIRIVPVFALCALAQGIYNLLPLYPLDGSRALQCILDQLTPSYTNKICSIIEWCTVFSVAYLCIRLYLHSFDCCFLLLGAYFLVHRALLRKIPCKEGQDWVQYS